MEERNEKKNFYGKVKEIYKPKIIPHNEKELMVKNFILESNVDGKAVEIRCSIWNKRINQLDEIKKGDKVSVYGELEKDDKYGYKIKSVARVESKEIIKNMRNGANMDFIGRPTRAIIPEKIQTKRGEELRAFFMVKGDNNKYYKCQAWNDYALALKGLDENSTIKIKGEARPYIDRNGVPQFRVTVFSAELVETKRLEPKEEINWDAGFGLKDPWEPDKEASDDIEIKTPEDWSEEM